MRRTSLVGFLFLAPTICFRVSEKGTLAEEWDRISWKEFWKLLHEAPQAGIHIESMPPFSCRLYIRTDVLFDQKRHRITQMSRKKRNMIGLETLSQT